MGRSSSSTRAVAVFAVSGLLVLVAFGVLGVLLLRSIGRREAVRDAKELTELAGRGIAAPALTPADLHAGPRQLAELDRVVGRRVVSDPVVRVKIWAPDGRIIYSDEHRLVGEHYRLGADELEALDSGKVVAELSDLGKPENRFERHWHKLLEVYLPIRGPNGRPLLFEEYLRYSSVAASGRRVLLAFAPALLVALFVLWLVQVPLASRLAKRVREGQLEREALLRRAVESSQLERRRVAHDLHDGAVQNLAGVAYSLSAAVAAAPAELVDTLEEAAGETRRTIRELRSLLVEIYPPDLHRTGLESALRDLVAPLAGQGIEVSLDFDGARRLPPDTEALFFRAAQEAIRNVAAHAGATTVRVVIDVGDAAATLVVADDGRGFDPDATEKSEHFGLRLIDDLARDSHGTLTITSHDGAGTTVRLEVPVA